MKVGDRVVISQDYKPYKSMRGLHGAITWIGLPLYQINVDHPPARLKGKDFCFVTAKDLDLEAKP